MKMFGYSKQDLKNGLNSKEISAPGMESVTKGIYEALKKTGEALPTEKMYKRRDGNEFPGIVGAAMLRDSKSQFISFILDRSETQKLKEINLAKDEFVAIASHQLRTPATSVKQYLGVLMQEMLGPVTPDQMKYLAIAYKANERQLAIINDLLKTAQIDTGGYQMTFGSYDMVTVLQQVLHEYKPVLDQKQQKLDVTVGQRQIMATFDETEIMTCLSNLIENASKYSPHASKISVGIKADSKYASISVQDRGVGIDVADQEKIFQKFTRVDNELSDTVTGTGLGLYWVKRIVELHHGTISLSSVPGKGTTFTVRLPL